MKLQNAPHLAIDLVNASTTVPFADAVEREQQTFLSLRTSSQAKALRHVFFAERAAKTPDWLKHVKPVEIRKALVIGGGTMGASIAYALNTAAGIGVTIIERDRDGAERASSNAKELINAALQRELIDEEKAADILARIAIVTSFDRLPNAELAIEAVFEDMEVKRTVLAELDAVLRKNAIIATNTSYLDIDEMASVLADPSRLVGLHFFAPVHIMKLLEIVRGEATGDTALATAFVLAKRLRKIPVLAGVCDGFIGNRILSRYRAATETLLLSGATPWDIDEAMAEFGYMMGPYEAQDMSGLDIAHANRIWWNAAQNSKHRQLPVSNRLFAEGRLGVKTGAGWYRYPGGEKTIDPLVEDLIREEARFAGVKRWGISHDEIRRFVLAEVIKEAADILDEGIAQSAADIDLVLIHGYGFPRWRGGLMHYAAETKMTARA